MNQKVSQAILKELKKKNEDIINVNATHNDGMWQIEIFFKANKEGEMKAITIPCPYHAEVDGTFLAKELRNHLEKEKVI